MSPAIFLAPLQLMGLQQVSVQAQNPYDSWVSLSTEGLEVLDWCIKNLDLWNECPFSFPPPKMVIFSDAAKTGGWGGCWRSGTPDEITQDEPVPFRHKVWCKLAYNCLNHIHTPVVKIRRQMESVMRFSMLS